MGRARLGEDGRYYGDLPCKWCDVLIPHHGRKRPRQYCRMSHRWKTYGTNVVAIVLGILG